MWESASCVDWFISCQIVDLLVEAVSLCLLEDRSFCGHYGVVFQFGGRVFVVGVCFLSSKILAALIMYAVARRILVHLENLLQSMKFCTI